MLDYSTPRSTSNSTMKSHAKRKAAQKIEQHKFERSRPGSILKNVASSSDSTATQLKAKAFKTGQCPLYNGGVNWVSDLAEEKIYMVLGYRPGKEHRRVPTSDFFCFNAKNMEWRNLTKTLRFRNPFSPERTYKELPALALSDATIIRIHDIPFLLIFGGYDVDAEEACSDLIVVHLRNLEWWYQAIEGGPVAGRIDPTIVAIDQKLYIFGGYQNFEGDGKPQFSYSIASLSDRGLWRWEVRDVQYSQIVPVGSIFGRAVPVYNGKKILLMPSRTTHTANKGPIDFSNDNMFYFHIERQKFQPIDVIGEFPEHVLWYYSFPLDDIRKLSKQTQRRGSSSQSSSDSSVLICGWRKWVESGGNDATPELWHLQLTPTECIRKLDIGPKVHEVDVGFEGAALLQDRLLLLGSSADSVEYDVEAALNPDARHDRYIEIPLHSQGLM